MFTPRWLFPAVVLLLAGVATHSTYAGSGDEPHYLAIAHSIAFDRDFDMGNNYGTAEPLIASGGLDPDVHVRTGIDGTPRPVHDVGLPLLFAPYVRVAAPLARRIASDAPASVMQRLRLNPTTLYRHMLSTAMVLMTGWLAVLMYRSFVESGAASDSAARWALLVSVSPPLLVMAILFFTEVVSAIGCLLLFRVVTRDRRLTAVDAATAGSLGSALLLVHVRNVGIVGGLLLIGLARVSRGRSIRGAAALLASFAPLLAARTAINYEFWGSLITSPHARPGDWPGLTGSVAGALNTLGGLFFDQEYGLILYAPIFILAPLGLVALRRANGLAAAGILAAVGSYLLTLASPLLNAHGWTGGWSPAARFLTPVVPMLAIAAVAGARMAPRPIVTALVALQIGINAYFWQNPKNLWNNGDGVAAVCARGGLPVCSHLPSFVDPPHLPQQR